MPERSEMQGPGIDSAEPRGKLESAADNPDSHKEQRNSREAKVKRLNELEGIFTNLDMALGFKNLVSQELDEKGNLVDKVGRPLAEKIKDIIKKGHEGQLTGVDKTDAIKHAISARTIKEQDITDRINGMYNDLVILEEQMQTAKDDDEVHDLARAVVDKYTSSDWPD